jgi:hypothetical protein
MKRVLRFKKRTWVLTAIVAVVAAMASIGAYAYFTSTGSGTGSATVGSDSAWTVGQTTTSGGPLYPDPAIGTGNIQTKSYSVTNPSAGNQNLTDVKVSVANSDGSAWTSGSCSKNDFSVGGAAVGVTYTDTGPAGTFTAGQLKNDSVTVQMIDNGANQNDCRGLTVPLYFFAS